MKHDPVDIAALIGSRICHDLISPIGAINNGLELLDMAGGAPGPELELIGESVGNASARIRFFRVAFGAAGEQMVGRAEVMSILRDVYGAGRLDVAWGPLDPFPRADVRMVFLAIQCMETAMPYGGRIEIAENDGRWMLTAQADKLNVDEDLWALLADPVAPENLRPAHVQFLLLPKLVAEADRKITMQSDPPRLTLRF